MAALPITSLVAAIFAVMLVALSLPVSFRRIKVGAESGDGGDETLRRRIRAQGNFIEYVPLALLVLAFAEAAGAGPALLWTAAAALLLGRLLHAAGMLGGVTAVRAAGMLATYAVLLIGAGAILVRI